MSRRLQWAHEQLFKELLACYLRVLKHYAPSSMLTEERNAWLQRWTDIGEHSESRHHLNT